MAGYITGVNQAMTDQNNKAFELKLQNAKLEQEHQDRLGEMAQQEESQRNMASAAAATEKAKYERENTLNPSLTDAFNKLVGSNMSGLHTQDVPGMDALAKYK